MTKHERACVEAAMKRIISALEDLAKDLDAAQDDPPWEE